MVVFDWPDQGFLHIRHKGNITGEQLISCALEMAGDERLDTTHYILGDWSEYDHSYVSQEDVKTLVALMKSTCQICPRVKNAVVIRPDRSGNALVAFYKMLADDFPWEIEIFHKFEDAYDWFELPIPEGLANKRHTNESSFIEPAGITIKAEQKNLYQQ